MKHIPLGTNPVTISTIHTVTPARSPTAIELYPGPKQAAANFNSGSRRSSRDGNYGECEDGEDELEVSHCES
jgi:hypothetical protein